MSRTKEFYHDEINRGFIDLRFVDDTYQQQLYEHSQELVRLKVPPLSDCCNVSIHFVTAPNLEDITICSQCSNKCKVH